MSDGNLLAKVVKGPYQGVGSYTGVTGVWDRDRKLHDLDDNSNTATTTNELLNASYDHALLLAGIFGGHCYWSDRGDGSSLRVGGVVVNQVKTDPFGCPILTDDLRAELERLLGITP